MYFSMLSKFRSICSPVILQLSVNQPPMLKVWSIRSAAGLSQISVKRLPVFFRFQPGDQRCFQISVNRPPVFSGLGQSAAVFFQISINRHHCFTNFGQSAPVLSNFGEPLVLLVSNVGQSAPALIFRLRSIGTHIFQISANRSGPRGSGPRIKFLDLV